MLRLYHYDVDVSKAGPETSLLLSAVADFQENLNQVSETVRYQRMSYVTPEHDWRQLQENQNRVIVSDAQFASLSQTLFTITPLLNFSRIDLGQKFAFGCFNDTVLDILVHAINDNHRLSKDPHMRNLNILWERHIISPAVRYLSSISRLDILANEPLVGDAQIMEAWTRFDGDPKRGMFQTAGSMLSKGFFKALIPVCETTYLPSSFVGNLVGWGLHALDPEDRDDIYLLLSIIHSLPHYKPSSGVVEKILSYEPGLVTRPVVDIIMDGCISHGSDLRDIDVPVDIEWQTALLSLAKNLVSSRFD
jgi:hypothetical protein